MTSVDVEGASANQPVFCRDSNSRNDYIAHSKPQPFTAQGVRYAEGKCSGPVKAPENVRRFRLLIKSNSPSDVMFGPVSNIQN